jgi:hypothetical protein
MHFKRNVNRAPSRNEVGNVVTYAVKAPVGSHRRTATCAEVECADQRDGWVTFLDVSIPAHAKAMRDLRMGTREMAGLRYRELSAVPGPDGQGEIAIVHPRKALYFPPGQECLRGRAGQHTVPLEREPILLVRGGDHRADLGLIRRHVTRDDWVEDFAGHQDKLAQAAERG